MESTIGMQSHFSSMTLAEVFRDLYLGERSGVLTLRHEDTEKRIYFDRGLILYADSNLPQDDLGQWLVRESHISPGALDEARQNAEGQQGLIQALINRELVSKSTVAAAVGNIVRDVVCSVFRWESGTLRFGEGPEVADVLESDILSTFEVILQGIFEMSGFEAIQEAMTALDNRLGMREPSPLPVERLTLSPAHGFVLSRLDGTTNAKDVISILPDGDDEPAIRFVFGLLIMGILEYRPPLGEGPFRVANILRDHADRRALEKIQERTIHHVYEQMKGQSPYEILGITPSATPRAIESAYGEAKELFSRDRILPQVREQFREEIAVIESRLVEAYLKLFQPESAEAPSPPKGPAEVSGKEVGLDDLLVRVEMDKSRSKLAQEKAGKVAESYHSKARQAIREGDFHNAIQYAKLAISYNEEDARYYFLLAECLARNPQARWQRMAEENYARATELDPWNADYFICLGRFYKRQGMGLRARKQFQKALELAPQHEDAAQELKNLG